jgi:acetyl-CoA C-acetyltransferase
MGLGLVGAVAKILKRNGPTLDEMARVEINEAFAVQVLAVLAELEWRDDEKLNVNGSRISLGHPIGATGLRILTAMLHDLRRPWFRNDVHRRRVKDWPPCSSRRKPDRPLRSQA